MAPMSEWQVLTQLDRNLIKLDLNAQVPARAQDLFEVFADPYQHPEVFDVEIKSVNMLHEDAQSRRFDKDELVPWRFFSIRGRSEVKTTWEVDRKSRKVHYRLREPGFMKVLDVAWAFDPAPLSPASDSGDAATAQGLDGCSCMCQMQMEAKATPPGPLKRLLKRGAALQLQSVLTAAVQAAQRKAAAEDTDASDP